MRPRRVGEVLDAGVKIYVRNARILMGIAALAVVPLQAVSAIVLLSTLRSGSDVPIGTFSTTTTARPSDPVAVLGAQATLGVISLFVSALVTGASVKAVSDTYLDQPTGIGTSLRYALRRVPALVWMEILTVIGVFFGFLALIVPGIWLYAAWSVAVPALLIERTGPMRSLRRSVRLVRGRWWPTAAVLLVSTLMVSLVAGAIQAVLVAVARLPSHPSLLLAVTITSVASAVSSIIATPFRATVTTVLYYDLRVRHEGYDLQLLADQLGLPELSPPDWPEPGGWSPGPGGYPPGPGWPPGPAGYPSPIGPESVGQPGGPPYWPPPPWWRPTP
jgi:hypothetical protein